ncbi:hypothetical protein LJC58_02500 [Lachnospiraceae bacterium OttesenSCG-928-D06]|nr:hypothetical protein [Lachnospiraceae bacterium OttesenSCG-928-D06]
MLNEDRIVLMTKMASYEANEGKKNVAIGKYFRSDYITLQVLKSIISATVAFGIIIALFVFYDFEVLMQEIYKMDLISFAKNILIWYGVTIVSYGVISYIVYSWRYAKARKNLKSYYSNLKKLNAMYDNQ